MADPNKPVPRGAIPYGFHIKTKNGNALVMEYDKGPLGVIQLKVLYGIQDNRRIDGWITLGEVQAWHDKGIADGAYFHEYTGGIHERRES